MGQSFLPAMFGIGVFLGLVDATPVIPKPCQASHLITCLNFREVPFKLPCDSDWANYSTTYNIRLPVTPAAVVIPEGDKILDHVKYAVMCAGSNGVKVQAKSGGRKSFHFRFERLVPIAMPLPPKCRHMVLLNIT